MPQEAAALEKEAFLRVLLMGFAKVGKAEPIDEPVLTPTGWRPIGDIAVGDQVIGSTGKPVQVTAIYPQGRKPIVRVSASDGMSVRCGLDHLWETTTKKELTKGRWDHTGGPHATRKYHCTGKWGKGSVKTTREIAETIEAWHYLPTLTGPVHFARKAKLTFDPYCIGLLIGDGNLTGGNVSLDKPDQEILQAIVDYARTLGDEGAISYYRDHCPRVRVRGTNMRDLLDRLGLWGLKSPEKFIPKEVFISTPSERLAMLQGLLDTDGYAMIRENGRGKASQAEFCSSSHLLAEGVVDLVRSLGGRARLRYKPITKCQTGLGLPAHIVSLSLPICPFRLKRKGGNWMVAEDQQRFWRPRIKSVTPEGKAECVCISVDSADGLYVTKDYLLTHNTRSTIVSLVTAFGSGYVICCGDKNGMAPASRITKKFVFDVVRDETDMEGALKEARRGIKESGYKWVFVDDFSLYSSWLEGALRDASASSNKSGKPDGRTWSPDFKSRLLNTVRRTFDLKAHVVYASHYIEQSGEIEDKETGNKQRSKSGVGILPMIYGSAREELPAIFQDVLFMEKIGDRRVFQVNPGGCWGPGCRDVDGTHTIDASFADFLKLTQETNKEIAKPNGKK